MPGREALDTPDLDTGLNRLELEQDRDGVWRRAVNGFTGGAYTALARGLDQRVFLRAPGFETVLDWRCEQEEGLLGRALTPRERDGIADFIQYFERLTRQMIDGGVLADVTVKLDRNRLPVTITP